MAKFTDLYLIELSIAPDIVVIIMVIFQDIFMSPNLRGGGHIDFGADPIGVGVGLGIGVVGFFPNFHGYIIRT